MKKFISLFAKGMALGLGIGLCLAGFVALVYRAIHSGDAIHSRGPLFYFLIVGGLMGLVGGWCLSLQMILGGLLSTLFMKVSELVPMPAQTVGEEWAKKMETFFREVIQPFPRIFRKFVEWVFILRFEDYGRINRALEKAKRKKQDQAPTAQWALMVVLHYLLEPLWLLFYAAYAILLLISCVFWSFAFIR